MSLGSDFALTLRSFSKRQWRWFILCLIIGLAAVLWLANGLNQYFSVTVASTGGSLTEGIIGAPRFINPLLAVSDSDRDLTALIYSGLMRIDETGKPMPDLARSYEVSTDGLIYTFRLRNNLVWQDGTPLTSDDVEFTIASAQDPILKSPKRPNWDGVKVEKTDPRTVVFRLKQPYPSFLENATIGILPKHIWSRLTGDMFALNQFNTESVGSGPYRIKNIQRDNVGIPEYYDLKPFERFALGAPKISNLRLRFYPGEIELLNAYRRGEVEAVSAVSAESARALEALGARVLRNPLPRVFGVFFNQGKAPVLANKEVRQALNLVIDRPAIIAAALRNYGLPATGPLTTTSATSTAAGATATTSPLTNFDEARALLVSRGWSWNQTDKVWEKKGKKENTSLTFTISTSDTPELKQAAELVRQAWVKLGAKVELKIFEIGDLNQNVIRPRQYDALFFGEILGRNPDPYAFWHSSQRLDPGLNIALYANSRADKLLENARHAENPDKINELYTRFAKEVAADVPAVFVYAPEFLYLLPAKVGGVALPTINTGADRFLNIHRWYIATDRVWPIFVNDNNKINKI